MDYDNGFNDITTDAINAIDRLISCGEEILLSKYSGESLSSKLAKICENDDGIPKYRRQHATVDYVDPAKYSAWIASVKAYIKSHFNEKIATEYIGDKGTYSQWQSNIPSNVQKIIELLKAIKTQLENNEVLMGTNNSNDSNTATSSIVFSPVINNTSTQTITQTFSFESVKKEVQDMDISETDRQEAIEKLDEMRQAAKSNNKKSFWRWGKENFLPWLIDKGSDLGVQLLGAYLTALMGGTLQ